MKIFMGRSMALYPVSVKTNFSFKRAYLTPSPSFAYAQAERVFAMVTYLWVALGSALGGMARYGFGLLAAHFFETSFPIGTILINIIGSFVIGFFGTLTGPDGRLLVTPAHRAFVMVGVCGGFTTFSSFSLQTLELAQSGTWTGAGANVIFSVVLCFLGVWLGHIAAAFLNQLKGA